MTEKTKGRLKVGDLIRVQYSGDDAWHSGIVVEVACDDNPETFYQMYCVEREAIHLLDLRRDHIELIDQICAAKNRKR